MIDKRPRSDPGPHARFPYGPALLCAACLAMCAWTWMRYSHAWDVTPERIASWPRDSLDGRYVVLTGVPSAWDSESRDLLFYVLSRSGDRERIVARLGDQAPPSTSDDPVTVAGRVTIGLTVPESLGPVIHIHAYWGRFHPASVAGIVVASMGMFVLGLYLRSYLKGRRADSTTATQRPM